MARRWIDLTRFTPTRVGILWHSSGEDPTVAVHPHARGDTRTRYTLVKPQAGSPPRAARVQSYVNKRRGRAADPAGHIVLAIASTSPVRRSCERCTLMHDWIAFTSPIR